MSKGKVEGEHWTCTGTGSSPIVREQQELRLNSGVEPGNRDFGYGQRSTGFFGRGSVTMAGWRGGETQSCAW